jgi:hypothetical protein
MEQYQLMLNSLGTTTVVRRISDNVFIPFDEANTDYQQYLKWLTEGNQPLPADEQGAN